MTVNLDVFRTATTLRWMQQTAFEPGRGDDGYLIADETHTLPLDTYTFAELGPHTDRPPLTDHAGIVVVEPETVEDAHTAIRAWCKDQLGRDDVAFQ